MARIRSIKPEFPQSETMGKISRDARLLFIQLWTIVDDEGRARAASRMLASLLYPYDDDAPKQIEAWLVELEEHGCVRRYEVDGSSFLDIPNWLKHQKIDRPTLSRLPAFSDGSPITREASRGRDADLGPRTLDRDLGSGTVDQTRVRSSDAAIELEAEFTVWYGRYPNKVGRAAARKAFAKARKLAEPQDLLDGLDRYIRSKPPDRQWCNPATWLNEERWKDQPAAPPAANVSRPSFFSLAQQLQGTRHESAPPDQGYDLDLKPAGPGSDDSEFGCDLPQRTGTHRS